MPPQFKPGDRIRLKYSPADIGVIVGEPRCFNQKYSYRANIAGKIAHYSEDDLEPCEYGEDPRTLFLNGSWGDRDSCLLFLTYLRISGNLSNYLYSVYNSRTQFMVHQFKPLIKFLDSPTGRLLMADEVGLGKTIEAGIVLLEMQARRALDRALIICPAKLRNKWRREMFVRFGLDFEIYDSRRLLARLHEVEKYPMIKLRGIASYEGVRTDRVRDALMDAAPDLDVVIADEAHRLRNPETAQHGAAATLAHLCDKMLLLTATPINNRSQDLFTLLQLLDPGLFASQPYFEQMSEVNRDVVELERVIRRNGPRFQERALSIMQRLDRSGFDDMFRDNHFFGRLRALMEQPDVMDKKTLVEAQRLANKVNLLSRHVARTRRVDMDEKRPKRAAHLCVVRPEPEEDALYRAVYEYLMRYYKEFPLPVMNMERILASCIPAFIDTYGRGQAEEPALEDTDWEVGDEDSDADGASISTDPGLHALLSSFGAPIRERKIDSKLEQLKAVLRQLDEKDPGCKIIIFSYYKPTIGYLARELQAVGYESVVIHGDVPTCPEDPERDEREKRRRMFEDPESPFRIMLSSEVGSEGLDFQFSHVVVNYDLPWNPMRVEQRIGRIDRIGQRAERLLIYSLILEGTIDQVIYSKLLAKIRIFEECIGDIESILGAEIRDLRDALFDSSLSAGEKEAMVAEKALVLERRLAYARELERDSAKIIGVDQYVKDEINRILSARRYIGPGEIKNFVHHVFKSPRLGLDIEEDSPGIFRADLTPHARTFFEQYLDLDAPGAIPFKATLSGQSMRWTYDYDLAAASPQIELFNLRHPAVAAVCKLIESESGFLKPVFAVKLLKRKMNANLGVGIYVSAVFVVEYRLMMQRNAAPQQRNELYSLCWESNDDAMIDDTTSAAFMSDIIAHGEDIDQPLRIDKEAANTVITRLEQRAVELFEQRREEIIGEENAFLEQRRRQIVDQAKRAKQAQEERKQKILEQLRWATLEGNDRRVQQLSALSKAPDAQMKKLDLQTEAKLAELPDQVTVGMAWELRSLGTVVVEQ